MIGLRFWLIVRPSRIEWQIIPSPSGSIKRTTRAQRSIHFLRLRPSWGSGMAGTISVSVSPYVLSILLRRGIWKSHATDCRGVFGLLPSRVRIWSRSMNSSHVSRGGMQLSSERKCAFVIIRSKLIPRLIRLNRMASAISMFELTSFRCQPPRMITRRSPFISRRRIAVSHTAWDRGLSRPSA